MPTSEAILNGLSVIANQWRLLAVVWHLYFAVLAGGLLWGVRPSRRTSALLLALPLVSVSILAWLAANPFNGALTGLFAIALLVIAFRMSPEEVEIAPTWLAGIGVVLAAFGWLYPHFLQTDSFVPYLYAAPTGLVPCPTLSIITGFSLILGGMQSRPWSMTLGVAGLFYGLFGALRLGVTIDLLLLVGAILSIMTIYLPKAGTPKALHAGTGA
jgi:hypothetical protein